MPNRDALNEHDIIQQYHRNIVLYKGEPVYVSNVIRDEVSIHKLGSNTADIVYFDRAAFAAYKDRIGMVNLPNSVVYLVRMPFRKMQIGFNIGNLAAKEQPEDLYSDLVSMEVSVFLKKINNKALVDTFNNNYPSLEDALKKLQNGAIACAFDKQFAVWRDPIHDYSTKLVYKNVAVGYVRESSLIFFDSFSHLQILLGKTYEQYI